MYCRYCGQLIEEDSIFCRYCGRQLKQNDEINEATIDSRILKRAVFSEIIDENDGLLELYPGTCNLKYVVPGYVDLGTCHLFMKDISRNGVGFDGKYNYSQTSNGDIRHIRANLNDGKALFYADLAKRLIGKSFKLFRIHYTKVIDDESYDRIDCSRWLNEDRLELFGVPIPINFYPSWSAEHYPTTEFCKKQGILGGNKIVSIEEWMDKYGSYFWADVQKYYDDLEHFLGLSPYEFFEYEKYK